jgi:hypothetical protein
LGRVVSGPFRVLPRDFPPRLVSPGTHQRGPDSGALRFVGIADARRA